MKNEIGTQKGTKEYTKKSATIKAGANKRASTKNDYELEWYKCEWCGFTHPYKAFSFWEVQVFKTKHILCADCLKHLKIVTNPNKGKGK